MNDVDLLNKRVIMGGIELGRVVDVILDEGGERPVGFDVSLPRRRPPVSPAGDGSGA